MLTDKINKGFDGEKYMDFIFIDLKKAFDTIDLEILLKKIRYIGFLEKVISWFESCLSVRTFKVNFDKKLLEPENLTSSVPERSTLDPHLF